MWIINSTKYYYFTPLLIVQEISYFCLFQIVLGISWLLNFYQYYVDLIWISLISGEAKQLFMYLLAI